MKRIIVHWTAGSNKASEHDKKHYHFLIDGAGNVVPGLFKPEDNLSTADGHYAAHTKNCNTGSIGVSLCGMHEAVEQPFKTGPYPINKRQWDRMILLVADLARKYKIPVTAQTVLTHAEVQPNLGIAQNGKWDITRLPWDSGRQGAKAVGDHLRAGVKLATVPAAPQKPVEPPKPAPTPVPVFPPVAAPAPSLWARIKALFRKGAK